MKKHYNKSYFFSEAFHGFRRNSAMTIGSIFLLITCLVFTGTFSTLIYAINYNLNNMDSLDSVIVFLKDGTEISEITDKLNGELAKYVDEYTVITKEEALEQQKDKYSEHPEIFEPLGEDNPLPDAIEIKYNGIESLGNLLVRLASIDGLEDEIRNNHDIAQKIEGLKQSIIVVFMWVWILVIFLALLVIINSIKNSVMARKHEIEVMRLSGAYNWFIILPFAIEAVYIALIAFVFAFPIQWYIYKYVFEKLTENISYINIPEFYSVAPWIAFGFLCGGLILGVIGSIVSVKKYSHK